MYIPDPVCQKHETLSKWMIELELLIFVSQDVLWKDEFDEA